MSGEIVQGPEKQIVVNATASDSFKAYPHQTKAAQEMTKHFLDKDQKAGVVVIPTGGGKTAVASRWLLSNWVSKGRRVLWLAHRHNLLDQAFGTFARAAHLAVPLKTLGMITVGGQAKKWSQVDARVHQVVFSTMQTTGRAGNIGFAEQMLADSPKGLMIVVDEAHHAAAPSYWRIAQRLKPLGAALLGLTATPVRTQHNDSVRLWNVFNEKIIYQVDMKELMEKEILASPHTHTIKTHINFEHEFTDEDRAHLQRFGELSQSVLERVSKNTTRNKLIVDHYVENQAKYGKTIVFATDILHARTLCSEFSRRGVRADYVDHQRKDSAAVMTSFRERTIPQVLINVEMLTEGYDAPDTKTVIIARPTNSESLVAQMVGRALRGVKAGGTREAHLVTFVDTWERFHVLTPDYLGLSDTASATDPETEARLPAKLVEISAELLEAAYNLVQSNLKGSFDSIFSCVPCMWFIWEEEYEDNAERKSVMVFDNQVDGFTRLENDLDRLPEVVEEELHGATLLEEYFANCSDPRPRVSELCALVNAWQRERNPSLNEDADVQMSAVSRYTFDEKATVRLDVLAGQVIADDVPPSKQVGYFRDLYEKHAVLPLIYRNDFKVFSEELRAEIARLSDAAAEATTPPPAIIEAVAQMKDKVKPWPAGSSGYSLQALWDAVCGQKAHFRGNPPPIQEIMWVESKTLWGFFRSSDRVIGVNEILNSPDIPRFVVEFLCYHEGLHADMPGSGHNADFRARERKFVPSAEAVEDAKQRKISPIGAEDGWRTRADQFLDTFQNKFAWAPAQNEK